MPQVLIVEDAPKVIERVKAEGFVTLGVASSTSLEKLAAADYAVASLRPDEVKKKVPQLRSII